MQREITREDTLLEVNGELKYAGYSKRFLLDYNYYQIKANKLRVKERDYYFITNGAFGIALSIADNGYMGLDSISLFDFTQPWEHTKSSVRALTLGKTRLPKSPYLAVAEVYKKKHYISFKHMADKRILNFHMDEFYDKVPIDGEIILDCPDTDSIVVSTPFDGKPTYFYYNMKTNGFPAYGEILFNKQKVIFDKEDSFGVLNWGRGVFPYKSKWYWGTASGLLNGVPFGFNIGNGVGNTSAATENMLFYNRIGHKLSEVDFYIPEKKSENAKGDIEVSEDYMSQWKFTSDDGRFEMDFTPVIDRSELTDYKLLNLNRHQVFGYYSGTVILDDGKSLLVKDMFGFAEKVQNKW